MMRRLLLWAIIGLVCGGLIGFVETWTSHRSERGLEEHGEYIWSALLALPSLPGGIITWQTHGAYDWSIDEDWNYRLPITVWNGVFWSVFFAIIGALRWWLIRSRK